MRIKLNHVCNFSLLKFQHHFHLNKLSNDLINYDVALVFLAFFAFGGTSDLSKSGYILSNSGTSSTTFLRVFKTKNRRLPVTYNFI